MTSLSVSESGLSLSDLLRLPSNRDLNYRKLTYDAAWPRTTPFNTAIGLLATNHVNLISLRTCKADVVVGLTDGQEEELEPTWVDITTAKGKPETGKAWAWSGKWAVMLEK
ncbi:hypothetical protein V1523DRAFT_429854 [Lipomyces doorenjongii]